MCGIGGFLVEGNLDDSFILHVLRNLTLFLQERGVDATGVYTSYGEGIIKKAPLPASQFVEFPNRFGRFNMVHTRAATHGSPGNNCNNHPLVSKSGMVMVHNGIVFMHPLADYPYSGETDSEVLLSYIDHYGIEGGIARMVGNAAFALCSSKKNPSSMWLFSYHNPLVFARVNKYGIIFASTKDILLRACQSIQGIYPSFRVYPNDIYELSDGELVEISFCNKKLMITSRFIELIGMGLFRKEEWYAGYSYLCRRH